MNRVMRVRREMLSGPRIGSRCCSTFKVKCSALNQASIALKKVSSALKKANVALKKASPALNQAKSTRKKDRLAYPKRSTLMFNRFKTRQNRRRPHELFDLSYNWSQLMQEIHKPVRFLLAVLDV